MAAHLNASRRVGGFIPRSLLNAASLRNSRDIPETAPIPATRPELETKSTVVVPEMPGHWYPPQNRILSFLFKWICLISMGSQSLDRLWNEIHTISNPEFELSQEKMKDRITTVTVVAGLILSATAALVTTTPPRPDIVNYNLYGPYILLLLSLTISLGGLIVGSTAIYFLSNKISLLWFRDRIMTSRAKVACWLILIGYPFYSIGVSTVITVLGLLVASFLSDHILVKVGGALVLTFPSSCVPVMMYMNYGPDADTQLHRWKHINIGKEHDRLFSRNPYSPAVFGDVKEAIEGVDADDKNSESPMNAVQSILSVPMDA